MEKKPLKTLGLSHVYGESKNLSDCLSFWVSHGLKNIFSWKLEVPSEKKEKLLYSKDANSIALEYLQFQKNGVTFGPGMELIAHTPGQKLKKKLAPAISIYLFDEKNNLVTDPDGNKVFFSSALKAKTTLQIYVNNVQSAADCLLGLGFLPSSIEDVEKHCFDFRSSENRCLENSQPLFQQLSCRILLLQDEQRPKFPKVDEFGLSGISLLVRDFDEIEKTFKIISRQEVPSIRVGEKREVAFYNESGILIEFLKITRINK